jgi:hypothetical protein
VRLKPSIRTRKDAGDRRRARGHDVAALLQNISPAADSPNLGFIPDTALDSLPSDWTGVVNALNTLIPANVAANAEVRNAINSLAASAKGPLLYSELRRELFTARRGRRDALPVLRAALRAAREPIYVETPAFSYTGYVDDNPSDPDNANDPPDPDTDLVSLITRRLAAESGLNGGLDGCHTGGEFGAVCRRRLVGPEGEYVPAATAARLVRRGWRYCQSPTSSRADGRAPKGVNGGCDAELP